MRHYRLLGLALLFALISAGLQPVRVSAHSYTTFCGDGTFVRDLLNVFQDQSQDGAEDFACGDDVHWGDSYGPIRGFNDMMTSFHTRDRDGDGYYSCVTFYEHSSYEGSYVSASTNRQAGGAHVDEDHIGSAWNDRVSSSWHYRYSTSGSCPQS